MGFFDSLFGAAENNRNKNAKFKERYGNSSDEVLIQEAIRIFRKSRTSGDGHAAVQILKSRGYSQEDIKRLILDRL